MESPQELLAEESAVLVESHNDGDTPSPQDGTGKSGTKSGEPSEEKTKFDPQNIPRITLTLPVRTVDEETETEFWTRLEVPYTFAPDEDRTESTNTLYYWASSRIGMMIDATLDKARRAMVAEEKTPEEIEELDDALDEYIATGELPDKYMPEQTGDVEEW